MFHLSVKTISRATGRCCTAAIAYRTGSKVVDVRTGEIHDYTKKRGVEHCEIILPSIAPTWANDRTQLWNAAEQAEKRINSTVAREFEIGIPHELGLEQSIELIRCFAKELVNKHQFAIEFAIHSDDENKWDGTKKDIIGFHAHVLCTTRRLDVTDFGEKTRELDGAKAGREHIEYWRERWAEIANSFLAASKKIQRIDHRSLKKQGIERAPTQHLGAKATSMERKGIRTSIGDVNRRLWEAFEQGKSERNTLDETTESILIVDQDIRRAIEFRDQLILRKVNLANRQIPIEEEAVSAAQEPLLVKTIDLDVTRKLHAESNRWEQHKQLQNQLAAMGKQNMIDRRFVDDLDIGLQKSSSSGKMEP